MSVCQNFVDRCRTCICISSIKFYGIQHQKGKEKKDWKETMEKKEIFSFINQACILVTLTSPIKTIMRQSSFSSSLRLSISDVSVCDKYESRSLLIVGTPITTETTKQFTELHCTYYTHKDIYY